MKRGEKFASSRADWTKKSNISQMFDVIYDELVDAKVAVVREEPVFTDREGNIVEESKAFGLLQDIEVTHPEYILFGDETGCNTSQKKDGHIAGTKYVCTPKTTPQLRCSTSDHRFTMLLITAGTGDAVCCVIIFQTADGQVPLLWAMGVDVRHENPVRSPNDEI